MSFFHTYLGFEIDLQAGGEFRQKKRPEQPLKRNNFSRRTLSKLDSEAIAANCKQGLGALAGRAVKKLRATGQVMDEITDQNLDQIPNMERKFYTI